MHRLVLLAFRGEAAGRQARHINGNSLDNRLDNLSWGSQSENEQDKHQSGTYYSRGRKLTDEQVRHIRSSPDSGRALARQLGVTQSAISKIRTRKSYKHLELES